MGAERIAVAEDARGRGPDDAYAVLDAYAGREHRSPMPGGRAPGPLSRSLALWGAAVDRVALEALHGIFLTGDRPDLGARDLRVRLDALVAAYGSPELLREPSRFFRPTAPAEVRARELSRLPGGARTLLTWRSTYRTFDPAYQADYDAFERNQIARAHHWAHAGGGRTTLVCLHSWCGGILPLEERIFAAARLYELGHDVVLLTLPFHGARTPRQARFGGQLFPSREVRRTNEAFGQAIADLRSLVGWLRARGAGPIGVAGISLGGYVAALAASLDPDLAFAAPIVAPASFADILWHHGQGRGGRRDAERAGVGLSDLRATWAIHTPLRHTLRIPRERALVIWADGDVIVPRVHSLALWEHWGRPAEHAFAGGHILQLGLVGWQRALARRLEEVAS